MAAYEHNVGNTEQVLSAVGGMGLTAYGLSRRRPIGLLWTGIGLALLYRGVTARCPLYARFGLSSAEDGDRRRRIRAATRVDAAVIVNRSPDELYRFWRAIDNLPKFMHHLDAVSVMSGDRSHWAMKTPRGVTVTWEGVLSADDAGRRLAWHATGKAEDDYGGTVEFAPHGEQTEVRLAIHLNPQGGLVGRAFATLLGANPKAVLDADLQRFKQLMETSDEAVGQPRNTG